MIVLIVCFYDSIKLIAVNDEKLIKIAAFELKGAQKKKLKESS